MTDPKETITVTGRISRQELELQFPSHARIPTKVATFDDSELVNTDYSEIEKRYTYLIEQKESEMSIRGLAAATLALMAGASIPMMNFNYTGSDRIQPSTPWERIRHRSYTGMALQEHIRNKKRLRARNLTRANRKRARRGY